MAAGTFPLTSTLVLPTAGHNDAINIMGICGGGNISSGETEPPAATAIEFTGSGPAISQVVPSGGNQNDRVEKIGRVEIDGNQNTNSNSAAFSSEGPSKSTSALELKSLTSPQSGDYGIQVFNNNGINTNDWREYGSFGTTGSI